MKMILKSDKHTPIESCETGDVVTAISNFGETVFLVSDESGTTGRYCTVISSDDWTIGTIIQIKGDRVATRLGAITSVEVEK